VSETVGIIGSSDIGGAVVVLACRRWNRRCLEQLAGTREPGVVSGATRPESACGEPG